MMTTRLIIWITTATLILFDVYLVIRQRPTISSQMRAIDVESGYLVRWMIAGLWLHWYGPHWW